MMLPSRMIYIGCTLVGEGSVLLEDAITHEGFITPTSFTFSDIERTVKRLRENADRLEAISAQLLGNNPDRPKVALIAAE